MANQQPIVQPRSLLVALLWRALLFLFFCYLIAAFVDRIVLPTASPDLRAKAYQIKESASGVLADAAAKTHPKTWK